MYRIIVAGIAAALVLALPLHAQDHEGHDGGRPARDTLAHGGMEMMLGPLGIPRTRDGSGTSWVPDPTPMYAHHARAGGWELMLHYNVFLQYLDEGGERGDEQFGSTNWIMGMARRPLAGGEFGLRAMMSVEPLTVGECGYPDLLATGEFCAGGQSIVDHQHPHDLFMELTAQYQRALTRNVAVQLYGGPVGEPALGPTAFPHRASAAWNPIAPISHHWLDATHIAFGVATAGVYGRRWKVEGSLFNGREPDENRYDFDFAPLDSYSGRLSLVPSDRWALQISAGKLTEAEAGHGPGEGRVDVTRTTASATYTRPLGMTGVWASTAAWGRNLEKGEDGTNAFLGETSLELSGRDIVFARLEAVEKSAGDLVIPALGEEVFTVGKLSSGYVRQFTPLGRIVPGIGAGVSLSLVPQELEPFYGSKSPLGFMIFLQFHPARMEMGSMDGGM